MAQARSAASGRTASSNRQAATGRTAVGDWGLRYEADALPQDSTPTWTRVRSGTPTEEILDGKLHLSMTAAELIYYNLTDAALSDTGFILETRVKVVSSSNFEDCVVAIELGSGTKFGELIFYEDRITIWDGQNTLSTYTMDTTDDYHVYRVTISNDVMTVYVDSIRKMQSTLVGDTSSGTILFFGSFNTGTIEHYWDYVYYSTDGSFVRIDP